MHKFSYATLLTTKSRYYNPSDREKLLIIFTKYNSLRNYEVRWKKPVKRKKLTTNLGINSMVCHYEYLSIFWESNA
ncbi:MAG: hypothetical protein KME21_24055 [Desmonostoc vinosum HA7617-LM4]|jgi:hypothetical protein|nr:hypothetical protein [Desmonostoc vinosum HA7617-LM4]